jgi:hypothetical protein
VPFQFFSSAQLDIKNLCALGVLGGKIINLAPFDAALDKLVLLVVNICLLGLLHQIYDLSNDLGMVLLGFGHMLEGLFQLRVFELRV